MVACKITSNHKAKGGGCQKSNKHVVFFWSFLAETVVRPGREETESLNTHLFRVLASPSLRSQSTFLSPSVIDTD